ncbi:MAG: UDP-N-acetylmuramate--L-alanine ligase [Armatimonadota bacterium]
MIEGKKFFFTGIGGCGMSGIASILHSKGYEISGSDKTYTSTVERLKNQGIDVYIGHSRENIKDIDVLVYTAAVSDDNPEIIEARKRNIRVIERAEMLGYLMEGYKHRIGVTGTHGKTTVSSMIAVILSLCNSQPTAVIGGDVQLYNTNAILGDSDIIVAEACEAYGSFLHLRPTISVITNIESEHLDYYKTFENIVSAFSKYIENTDKDGCVIGCVDDTTIKRLFSTSDRKNISYGLDISYNFSAQNIDVSKPSPTFDLYLDGVNNGRVVLNIPGLHNVINSLAAIAACVEMGLEIDKIKNALAQYTSVKRRFEKLYDQNDILIIDDYAHHPTELKSTLTTAKKSYKKRVIAIFQPHLYSRTKDFKLDFASALSIADKVIVSAIYASREKYDESISGKEIVDILKSNGYSDAEYMENMDEIIDHLFPNIQPNDMILTIGAGDIRNTAIELIERLQKR